MKKKILTLFLAASMTAALLAGCGSGDNKAKGDTETKSESAEKSTDEKTLVYGSGDYTNINPALYEHGEINSLIFAGLTAHDEEDKVVPALAESWEWDEASKSYTFHLRKDVKFHDGEAFTSADVKFTLDTIMDPDNASEIASNYEDITGIETPDDSTVKITLKAPNVAMLDYLTIGILPKHLLEGKGRCDR